MASLPERFVACPECGCHAKAHETDCPHCGARLRRRDGSLPRTAAAVLMGLTALATGTTSGTTIGCSDTVETGGGGGEGGFQSAAAYGVGGSISSGGGMGGAAGGGGMGVGGAAPAYGVAETDNDKDGYTFPSFDCNDNDANIHPNAPETPGDGIDSNCNNEDNT